jgi:hypothetical protein
VKKLLVLAFVPVLDVIRAFELVADDDGIDDLLGYFEETWTGEPKTRIERNNKYMFNSVNVF